MLENYDIREINVYDGNLSVPNTFLYLIGKNPSNRILCMKIEIYSLDRDTYKPRNISTVYCLQKDVVDNRDELIHMAIANVTDLPYSMRKKMLIDDVNIWEIEQ